MSSNWVLYRDDTRGCRVAYQYSQGISQDDVPQFGSSVSADFEINTAVDAESGNNDIYRLSARGADRAFETASQQSTHEPVIPLANDFEASLNLTDKDIHSQRHRNTEPSPRIEEERKFPNVPVVRNSRPYSVPNGQVGPNEKKQSVKRRRAPPAPTATNDLPVTDPYEPYDVTRNSEAEKPLVDHIASHSKLLSSPYVYRDGSPPVRKLAYKVVKGRAPQPPSTSIELACEPDYPTSGLSEPSANHVPQRSSVNEVVYRREDKRPAPQPPSIYEHDFWESVEEEASRPLPSTGGVEARVRRKQKDERQKSNRSWSSQSINVDRDISLTFRDKMLRFFGLTGKARRRRRSTFSFISSSSNNNVRFGSGRDVPVRTMQSFSFAHSKSYNMRPDDEPAMGGGYYDPITPDIGANRPVMARYGEVSNLPAVQRAWSRSNNPAPLRPSHVPPTSKEREMESRSYSQMYSKSNGFMQY